jgi:hypothetical protein
MTSSAGGSSAAKDIGETNRPPARKQNPTNTTTPNLFIFPSNKIVYGMYNKVIIAENQVFNKGNRYGFQNPDSGHLKLETRN